MRSSQKGHYIHNKTAKKSKWHNESLKNWVMLKTEWLNYYEVTINRNYKISAGTLGIEKKNISKRIKLLTSVTE
jgi:hypothetical protein